MENVTAMFSPRLYAILLVTTEAFELIGLGDGLTVDDGFLVGFELIGFDDGLAADDGLFVGAGMGVYKTVSCLRFC